MRRVRMVAYLVVGLVLAGAGRPVAAQATAPLAITNARIVTGAGPIIELGTIIIRDGRIAEVGASVSVPLGARVIDAKDLTLYPAFIDASANLGLSLPDPQPDQDVPPDTGVSASAAMREANRSGIRPELLAAQWLNLSEDAGRAHRQAGFGAALIAPPGGILAGQSCLVNLSGQPRRYVVVRSPVALHGSFSFRPSGYPGTLMGALAHVRQTLLDAQRYDQQKRLFEAERSVARPPYDECLEALGPLLRGEETLIFQANSVNDIKRALDLAREFNLRIVVSGATDGWKVANELAAARVPVILNLDFGQEPDDPDKAAADAPETEAAEEAKPDPEATPYRVLKQRRTDWEERVAGAAVLHRAGVPLAFSTAGVGPPELVSNLRKAVAAGLPVEVALNGLTTQPAQLFGVERTLGTIERGKLAHLVALTDVFGAEDAQVRYLIVEGRDFAFEVRERRAPAADAGDRPQTAATPNLTGVWDTTLSSDEGDLPATLTLRQDSDGNLQGELRSEFFTARVTGKVTGNRVELNFELAMGGQTMTITMGGEVAGDRMSGSGTTPFGESRWEARRTSPAPEGGLR